MLEAYDIEFHELLNYAPWLLLCSTILAFVLDLSYTAPDAYDPYDPAPGTKWTWQSNPELRSNEEPPPNDLMKEELALYETNQGPWPSWYIGWNYTLSTWDWGRGWRRDGRPADSKRGPANLQDRWYWQENANKRLPDETPATAAMLEEETQHRTHPSPWPSWYLLPEFDGALGEAPARENLVWGREWRREEPLNMSEYKAPPPHRDTPASPEKAWATVYSFLVVYALIVLADWIQGPYVYAIYKEMGIPEGESFHNNQYRGQD